MGYCEEIESQTQNQEVSIQFQWQPHGLEFTIAGLEEGVATALQLVEKEFEVYNIVITLGVNKLFRHIQFRRHREW